MKKSRHQASMRKLRFGSILLLGSLTALAASATWSVVAVNRATKEVAVASATCVTGIDLQKRNAVVRVGVGVGNVQASGDRDGTRRPIILRELINGTSSRRIASLVQLVTAGAEFRQFGFAQAAGNSASLTGSGTSSHASGVAGSSGPYFYAIQGNVLTGRPVVLEAERAFVRTPGPLPERVMAAMEAARAMGGDGRCSCSENDPTSCGSPPASFSKSADNGYMIVTRLGDRDGKHCDGDATGCANGDYYLNINVPNQGDFDPDPVLQMRARFDAWRQGLRNRPDAIESSAEITRTDDGYEMKIELRDSEGRPITRNLRRLKVTHAARSARATAIGKVVKIDKARYTVPLAPNGRSGVDRLEVIAQYGRKRVVLAPLPEIDDGACAVRVRKTKARNRSGRLAVEVRLKGAERSGQEVEVKITSRLRDPVFASLGLTNRAGKAKSVFSLPIGLYDVHVHSLVPAAGGECFDPDRKRQQPVATDVILTGI